MKKISSLIVLFFLLYPALPVLSEDLQITMRTSETPGLIRLVFEGMTDEMVKQVKSYHSYSLVKIEMPADFTFSPPKMSDRVDISQKGRSIFLNIVGLKGIKVFQLTDPPRLVVDIEVEMSGVKENKTEQEETAPQPALSGKVITLDPGHGGYDIGLMGSDYKEKDVVLSIAQILKALGSKSGSTIVLTRSSDRYTPASERVSDTYEKRPDLFISLHLSSTPDFVIYFAKMNSVDEDQARYELKYRQARYLGESETLARTISDSLKERFKRKVKIRQMTVPLLSAVGSPAIILEMPDGKYFEYSDADKSAIAGSLLKGMTSYEKK